MHMASNYKLPRPAIAELEKIIRYNDSCKDASLRVRRSEVITLLNQYGWSGSTSSLNRLVKSHFKRSFTVSK
jgi:hypothetical protein